MDLSLRGLYVPLITPFAEDGGLALDALQKLAQEAIDSGAAGLVALGTTGEPATLTAAERHSVLDVCAQVCRERGAALIAGAGSNDTAGSVRALRELEAWPEITAALVVVPYYTRPAEEGVIAHFAELAAQSPVPLIAYNVPYRTGQVLSADTLLRLAALPNVVAMKQAVGAIDADTVSFMAVKPGEFAVLAGDDAFLSPMLALGAAGGILASAHVRTRDSADLIAAWHAGRAAEARALGHRLAPLAAALFGEPNPTVIKGVLHAQGRIPTPAVRLPLLPASQHSVHAALSLL